AGAAPRLAGRPGTSGVRGGEPAHATPGQTPSTPGPEVHAPPPRSRPRPHRGLAAPATDLPAASPRHPPTPAPRRTRRTRPGVGARGGRPAPAQPHRHARSAPPVPGRSASTRDRPREGSVFLLWLPAHPHSPDQSPRRWGRPYRGDLPALWPGEHERSTYPPFPGLGFRRGEARNRHHPARDHTPRFTGGGGVGDGAAASPRTPRRPGPRPTGHPLGRHRGLRTGRPG